MMDPPETSRELDLLCHCDLASDAHLEVFVRRDAAGIDWHRFQSLIAFNAMGGLVAARLLPLRELDLPDQLVTYLEGRRRDHAMLQVLQTAESARLVDLLGRVGIRAIVLKGAALAHRLYAADPAARYSSDIDLLVAPEVLDAAANVLDQAGYDAAVPRCAPSARGRDMLLHLCYAFDFTHRATNIHVELHHRLAPNPHVLDLPFAEVADSCATVETPSGPLPALDGRLSVGYLGWHALSHPVPRVKWLSDFSRALVDLTPAERASLMPSCDAWGIGHGVRLAAALARAVYRNVGRDDILAALKVPDSQPASDWKCSHLMVALEQARDLEVERSVARFPAEISWLRFKHGVLADRRARRFERLRALCDPRDVAILGLSRRWSALYAATGPLLAGWRLVRRSSIPSGQPHDAGDH